MPYDSDRARSLIARAAFNAEFFRGTISDLSNAQRAMTFVGAPTWGMINGKPALRQNTAADLVNSAAVPAIVDVTADFSLEFVIEPHRFGDDTPDIIRQTNNGGFYCFWHGFPAVQRFYLRLQTNAGATAREIITPVASATMNAAQHVIITSQAGGTSGSSWKNGIPQVATLAGAGVAANCPATILTAFGYPTNATRYTYLLERVYPFALTNADASCLAEQAKLLVGGW